MNAPALCLTVTRQHVRDVWDSLQPMLREHWAEIAHYQDIPLHPDRQRYEMLEASGALRVFVATLGGNTVGYAVFVVQPNAHYSTSLQAVQDVLYLAPEYRRAGIGRALIEACDDALRAEGVQVVMHHVKLAHDFGPLLASLGYEPIETIHARRLDR